MKGKLCICSFEGDTVVEWDTDTEASVDAAKQTFDDIMRQGYRGFKVDPKTGETDPLDGFDPEAEQIDAILPMGGGDG